MGRSALRLPQILILSRSTLRCFEPVHGSAPDIAGKGIANPIGQIWTGKMMLDFMGYQEIGALILDAIENSIEAGVKTADLGGRATMEEVTESIIAHLKTRS